MTYISINNFFGIEIAKKSNAKESNAKKSDAKKTEPKGPAPESLRQKVLDRLLSNSS